MTYFDPRTNNYIAQANQINAQYGYTGQDSNNTQHSFITGDAKEQMKASTIESVGNIATQGINPEYTPSASQQIVSKAGPWGAVIGGVSKMGGAALQRGIKEDEYGVASNPGYAKTARGIETGLLDPAQNLQALTDDRFSNKEKALSMAMPAFYGIYDAKYNQEDALRRRGEAEFRTADAQAKQDAYNNQMQQQQMLTQSLQPQQFAYGGNIQNNPTPNQIDEVKGNNHNAGGVSINNNIELEDGEVTWNDYVFSDRTTVPDSKQSFATKAKSITNKYKDRLGEDFDNPDRPSQISMAKELEELKQQQEAIRQKDFNSKLKRTNANVDKLSQEYPDLVASAGLGQMPQQAPMQQPQPQIPQQVAKCGGKKVMAKGGYKQKYLTGGDPTMYPNGTFLARKSLDYSYGDDTGKFTLTNANNQATFGDNYSLSNPVGALNYDNLYRDAAGPNPNLRTMMNLPESNDPPAQEVKRNPMDYAYPAAAAAKAGLYAYELANIKDRNISMPRIQPNLVSYQRGRNVARQQGDVARATTRQNISNLAPGRGAALSNMAASESAISKGVGETVGQSIQSEKNTNAQIRNSVNAQNAQMAARESRLNYMDDIRQEQLKRDYRAGITNVGTEVADRYLQQKQYQETLPFLSQPNYGTTINKGNLGRVQTTAGGKGEVIKYPNGTVYYMWEGKPISAEEYSKRVTEHTKNR